MKTKVNMKYGPRLYINRAGISFQWWWFFPKYVVTYWWGTKGYPRRGWRVPNWNGIRR